LKYASYADALDCRRRIFTPPIFMVLAATDVRGYREVVRPAEASIRVPAQDPAALADVTAACASRVLSAKCGAV
jgi:hypothetical protein